ncbi:MAG TPA: class II aldolase/adducin family protein [Myxococcales bacterium]|nr:class II aldolase/adducin family protein [Myxococcales bacterium]
MSLLARDGLISTARAMNAAGLNVGTAGNLSVRTRRGFLITPTGMPYESLRPSDIVEIGKDGRASGSRLPSSEWRMHRGIYDARVEVDAILHCHAPHATAISSLRCGIPAFHYYVAVAGGNDIRCSPYATFGTEELAQLAVEALRDRTACLLANHGMLALAGTLEKALKLAIEVENLARQYAIARSAGEPVILDEREMAIVLEKFRTYGQQARVSPFRLRTGSS